MDTSKKATLLAYVALVLSAGAIIALCAFKILDRDFWWHIKAGEIMVTTHRLITTDPFAFTREGLPYIATHEWLAQIILYAAHALGGTAGVIGLRTAGVLASLMILLAIDTKRIWPNAFLLILTAASGLPSFMDRPQLFTFIILSTLLVLWSQEKVRIVPILILQILWANLHGGAAIVGLLFPIARIAQHMWEYRNTANRSQPFLLYGLLLLLCLLITPSGFDTIQYTISLFTDNTTKFINEWQPRAIKTYLLWIGPWWIAVAAALLFGKKKRIYWSILLVATGIASRQAFRHEVLFVLTATAAIMAQLSHIPTWDKLRTRILRAHIVQPISVTILLLLLTTPPAYAAYRNLVQRDYLYGYGVFAPAANAYDFLEKNSIRGNTFNTYGVGGYLIYKGYPERKVFIDGRNVDYGFDFMAATYAAGIDTKAWDAMEKKYNLTVALVDYDAITDPTSIPYSNHLDKNKSWALVFIDDTSAIYLKRTAENETLIKQFAYTHLTVSDFQYGKTADNEELQRVITETPTGVKARIRLATLLISQGKYADATPYIDQAAALQPKRKEIQDLQALIVANHTNSTRDENALSQDLFSGIAEDIQKYNDEGIAAVEKKHYEEAEKFFLQALMLDPGNPRTLNNLAALSLERGDTPKAIDYATRALGRGDDFADAHINLSLAFLKERDFVKAKDHAEKAKELGSTQADAILNIITSRSARTP